MKWKVFLYEKYTGCFIDIYDWIYREDNFIRKIMSKIWNIFIIWNFEYRRIKFENFSNTSEIREYYITMKNILESDSW